MSMSTYVQGIRLPDERWKQMKAVWEASEAAGIQVPEEVRRFFNWERPDSKGIVMDIDDAASAWQRDMQEGIDVDLSKLPPNITHIRLINSW